MRLARAKARSFVIALPVRGNGKFKSIPSKENYQAFRQKVKHIVNHSNYGASVKAQKLAPIVSGWRNYHRYCDLSGARDSLYFIQYRAYQVFNQEAKQNRYTSKSLLNQALFHGARRINHCRLPICKLISIADGDSMTRSPSAHRASRPVEIELPRNTLFPADPPVTKTRHQYKVPQNWGI